MTTHEITAYQVHPMLGSYWQALCSCGDYSSDLYLSEEAVRKAAADDHVDGFQACAATDLTTLGFRTCSRSVSHKGNHWQGPADGFPYTHSWYTHSWPRDTPPDTDQDITMAEPQPAFLITAGDVLTEAAAEQLRDDVQITPRPVLPGSPHLAESDDEDRTVRLRNFALGLQRKGPNFVVSIPDSTAPAIRAGDIFSVLDRLKNLSGRDRWRARAEQAEALLAALMDSRLVCIQCAAEAHKAVAAGDGANAQVNPADVVAEGRSLCFSHVQFVDRPVMPGQTAGGIFLPGAGA